MGPKAAKTGNRMHIFWLAVYIRASGVCSCSRSAYWNVYKLRWYRMSPIEFQVVGREYSGSFFTFSIRGNGI